jgi:hypothetical protein
MKKDLRSTAPLHGLIESSIYAYLSWYFYGRITILKNWTAVISKGMNREERDSIIRQLQEMSNNALKATKGA